MRLKSGQAITFQKTQKSHRLLVSLLALPLNLQRVVICVVPNAQVDYVNLQDQLVCWSQLFSKKRLMKYIKN